MSLSGLSDATKEYAVPNLIGIWGGGLIGLSTAAYYARKGIKSIIYDISEEQVARVNAAETPSNFEQWVGFSITEYITNGFIRATTDQSEFVRQSVKTHFVAVNTERRGKPSMTSVDTVLRDIVKLNPDLCIIESTVIPGSTETFGQMFNLPLAIATRRDWFTASENNLENCVRVYAGVNDQASARTQTILSVVCKRLMPASCCTVVELTKALDNGIFHTTAIYASQVASAYPDVDVWEALKLAATHWRLGNHIYFPSLGTGGPCVPLANQYLLGGAAHPDELSIATDAIQYDAANPGKVAYHIQQSIQMGERVAVLGICYRGDIRAHSGSPHVKFARELVSLGVSIGVHDPYYTDIELQEITGGSPMRFPEDLSSFKVVYIGANHTAYSTHVDSVLAHMKRGQIILDNQGTWGALSGNAQDHGVIYRRVGAAGWLSEKLPERHNRGDMPVSMTPADEHTVFATKFFRIKQITDEKMPSPDPWYVLDRPDSAIIIPVSSLGRFLLQRQYRPQIGRSSWEFPGGAIDRGETPQQAAARELSEETGIVPTSLKSLGAHHPIPGMSSQRTFIFVAQVTDQDLAEAHTMNKDEGISDFKIVDVSGFRSMLASTEIVDGLTLSAFAVWQASCS